MSVIIKKKKNRKKIKTLSCDFNFQIVKSQADTDLRNKAF